MSLKNRNAKRFVVNQNFFFCQSCMCISRVSSGIAQTNLINWVVVLVGRAYENKVVWCFTSWCFACKTVRFDRTVRSMKKIHNRLLTNDLIDFIHPERVLQSMQFLLAQSLASSSIKSMMEVEFSVELNVLHSLNLGTRCHDGLNFTSVPIWRFLWWRVNFD